MSLPKILVTGFGPFPGAPRNPSGLLAKKLIQSKRLRNYARVGGAIIPTVYEEVLVTFPQLIAAEKPDAILMFGLAARSQAIRIETRARNSASARHVDAAGKKAPKTIVRGASEFLRVRAPVRQLLAAARASGVKARLSVSAGNYVCNAALFTALNVAEQARKRPLAVFVHIPLPRQPNEKTQKPLMREIERAGEAILIALAASVKNKS